MPSRNPIHRMQGPDGNLWAVAAIGYGEAHAAIIAGKLESENVPVWVYRESAGTAFSVNFGELGNVYVLVPNDHYEAAVALLEDESDNLEEGQEYFDGDEDEEFFEDEADPDDEG